jgi:hypothetical protein
MDPLELTPLQTLSPAVERAAGAAAPAPVKLMTARGMAPLPPADLVVALYQLSFETDTTLRDAALKSAAELPDAVMKGALATALDVRVLDFYARRVTQRPAMLEVVLLNKATHDDTFRHLAKILGERDLEMIAKNEERMLRHPAIIAALYMNPKTRMSTAQRALELAVRNGIRVEGIPAFDEAAKAINESAGAAQDADAMDAAFREATTVAVDEAAPLQIVALDPTEQQKIDREAAIAAEADAAIAEVGDQKLAAHTAETEEKKKKLTDLSPAAKIRVATLGNAFSRSVLIRDKNMTVAMACIRSPGVSESEAKKYANDRSLDEDIIRYVSNHRQWTRLPAVRMALCNNPKTPLATTLRFLPLLGIQDLKALARSKGVPSAIAKAAKTLVAARGV